jgi:hypothetical protein
MCRVETRIASADANLKLITGTYTVNGITAVLSSLKYNYEGADKFLAL